MVEGGAGSVTTAASLVGLYLIYGYLLKNRVGGWAFTIIASPGCLFLLHWLLRDFDREQAIG